MKKAIVFACLILFACAGGSPHPKQTPASPQQQSSAQEAETLYGDYGRVAVAILQITDQPAEDNVNSKPRFLTYIDQPTSVRIVANAFQSYFSEEEAAQIANFLISPAGQAGIRYFSNWLLKGKFLKSPTPSGLPSTWDAFRSTVSGIKLFAEVFSLYKHIVLDAVKVGGVLVRKAIASDIGEKAALSILGALLKSGAIL